MNLVLVQVMLGFSFNPAGADDTLRSEVSSLLLDSSRKLESKEKPKSEMLVYLYKLQKLNKFTCKEYMKKPEDEFVTGYQFIHKDWSARVQIKKKNTIIVGNKPMKAVAWSAIDLLSEALRVEGYIPHVLKPEPPGILYACSDEIREDPLRVADLD